jgi:hypothetical protein
MKNKICGSLKFWVLILLIVLSNFARSQEIFSIYEYKQPKYLSILSSIFKSNNLAGMEISKFYPIGWSKDGKFAWIIRRPQGESDFIPFNFYIQDMNTDSIIWKNTYSFDLAKGDTLSSEIENDNFNSQILKHVWAVEKHQFIEKLKEYSVVQNEIELYTQIAAFSSESLKVDIRKEKAISDLSEYVKVFEIQLFGSFSFLLVIIEKETSSGYSIFPFSLVILSLSDIVYIVFPLRVPVTLKYKVSLNSFKNVLY